MPNTPGVTKVQAPIEIKEDPSATVVTARQVDYQGAPLSVALPTIAAQAVAEAEGARDAAVDARNQAEDLLSAGLTVANAKATIALGRESVADGEPFLVRPNVTDGLTRYTAYLRISESTQDVISSFGTGSEIDALQGIAPSVTAFCADVIFSDNTYTMTSSIGGGPYAGKRVRFEAPASSTGNVQVTVDGFGPRPLLSHLINNPIGAGGIVGSRFYDLEFDTPGNLWILVGDSTIVGRLGVVETDVAGNTVGLAALADQANSLDTRLSRSGLHHATAVANSVNDWSVTYPAGTSVQAGDWIRFQAPSTPTAALVVHMPEGVPQHFWNEGYGDIGAGGMIAGRWYVMERIINGGGSHYRIVIDDAVGSDARSGKPLYATGSFEAGSADLIVTTPGSSAQLFTAGTIFSIYTGSQESIEGQPLRISVNGYIAYSVLAPGASTYTKSIPGYSIVTVMWRGGVINDFMLMAVNSPVEADILAALRPIIIASPHGAISFSEGVKSVLKNRIVVTTLAMSLGRGAGADEEHVPSASFCAALKQHLDRYGEFDVVDDNQSVPGTVVTQFGVQWAASLEATKNIVIIFAGMNDFPVAAYNGGQTLSGFISEFHNRIRIAKRTGAIVIVLTCMHMHPDRYVVDVPGIPLYYPVQTYDVSWPYAFSTSDQSITGPFSIFGGQILTVGNTLRVFSGSNAGDHEITGFNSDRTKVFVDGSLTASVTESVLLRHVNQNLETVLTPAASASKVLRDWTGSGVPVIGDVRFWHGNNVIRAAAREHNVILVDVEQAFFKAAEEHGYDALYDVPNWNHPNNLGYQLGVNEPLNRVAFDVCRQLISAAS